MAPTPNGNAFLDTLADVRGGEILAELHQQLTTLVGSVRSIGKKGTITLQLTVELAKGSKTNSTLIITDDIKVKEPLIDREATIMYADDANRLSRRDPRQPRLSGLADVHPFDREATHD